MNEKDRILELVHKGIISTEEGIALLEKLGQKAPEQAEPKAVPSDVEKLIPELQTTKEEVEQSEEVSEESAEKVDEVETPEQEEANAKADKVEWEKQVNEALDQAKDALGQAGEQLKPVAGRLGSLFMGAFGTVRDTVKDNVDWKEINVKVPKMATTKFTHAFEFPSSQATLLEVENTNGNVTIKQWEEPGVKIIADVKIYGSIDGADPIEEFTKRSEVDVNDEIIKFRASNKRVHANLTVLLPARHFDHASVKTVNGSITFDNLEVGDVYAKSTNGDIDFKVISASMLEVEGVNGDIKISKGDILDTLINTVNGDVSITAAPQSVGVRLVNGDVKLTFDNPSLKKVEVSNMNGDVKVAFPAINGLSGNAKTNFGKVNSRFQNVEELNATAKSKQLYRTGENTTSFDLKTTTGSIFLKDRD
ncbi:MAG: daptomycin-sensing surface protein LiaX [Lactobacillales bacterium]|jgi:DUF4097 and DUF4098 domain-containing protein YvlB|nr:daptomycin-sensing surface protein LiaX [Lactobacillales bacterium]